MNRFGLYSKFKVLPGQRDLLVDLLLQAARLMELAPGCQMYVVNIATAEENTVWVTEIWDTEADHDTALSIEGVPPLIQKVMPLLASAPESIRVVPVGGKRLPEDN